MADPQELLLMHRTVPAARPRAHDADPQPGRATRVPATAIAPGSPRAVRRHEDPTLARACTGDVDAGQEVMRAAIERLGTEPRAHRQLLLLQDAARGAGDEVMAPVRVSLVELGGAEISLSAGALPDLIHACETRHADLQVAAVGPSFDGLADRGVPGARIAELEGLVRRFGPAGSAGSGDLPRLQHDVEQLLRLTAGIRSLDPVSAASLRLAGRLMAATMAAALRARGGDELDVLGPGGIPLEEYQERQRSLIEAGNEIREGMFANLTFTLQITMTGDRDLAVRATHAAHLLDEMVDQAHETAEAAEGATLGPVPVPQRGPTGEERAAQRRMDRQQQMEHARRLGSTRRH